MDLALDVLTQESNANLLFDESSDFITGNQLIHQIKKLTLELKPLPSPSVLGIACDHSASTVVKILAATEARHIVVLLPANVSTLEKYSFAQIEYFWPTKGPINSLQIQAKHPLYEKIKQKKVAGLVLFTSSTSGAPKGVVHNLTQLLQSKLQNKKKKINSMIATMSLDHIGGLNTLFSALSVGTCLFFPSNRSPQHLCQLIQDHQIECLPTTPSFLRLLLVADLPLEHLLSSLKLITYGAEPMPEEVLQLIHSRLPKTELKQTFGLSEVGILKTRSASSSSNKFTFQKSTHENYRIHNGFLEIKSENMMLGYLNAPSPITEDGWLQTEDFAIEDPSGIEIKGRANEVISVGGLKIYPIEIENLLLQLPQVSDALAFAKSNPLLGQIVAVKIAVANEYAAEPQDSLRILIKKHCQNFLEKSLIPVSIEFLPEIPLTSRFKKKRTP